MSYGAPVPHTGHAPTSVAATNTKAVVALGALNLLFVVLFLGLFAAGMASFLQQMQQLRQLQGITGF